MSDQDQTVILMFKDLPSYEKYKQEVLSNGGRIKNDLGKTLLGFTAVIPVASTLLLSLTALQNSCSLSDSGISSFELDKKVTIQAPA